MTQRTNVGPLKATAAIIAVACSTLGGAAVAEGYPHERIDYLLHVRPGGATDVLARTTASGLEEAMDATVVVENRPGGSGASQMALFTRMDPDGSSIGSVTASHLGMFLRTGNYTTDDVEWACRMVVDPYLLVVPSDSEIEDLSDLAEAAKANPGSLSIAGFGEASGGQIGWKIIEQAAGMDGEINWVPYDSVKDGVVAVLGGHNDVAISYVGLSRQHVESGALRVIGIMAESSPDLLPNAVPFSDQGFEVDNNWQQFRGIVMPKGTPMEIQAQFCSVVEEVMATEDFQSYLDNGGLNYGFQGPEEFSDFVDAQTEATKHWFSELGIGG